MYGQRFSQGSGYRYLSREKFVETKGYLVSVNWRVKITTTTGKRTKRTNNDLQKTTHIIKDWS